MNKRTQALNLIEQIDNNVLEAYDYLFNLKDDRTHEMGLYHAKPRLKSIIKQLGKLQKLLKAMPFDNLNKCCPECNSKNIRLYNDVPNQCLDCGHIYI